MYCTESDLMLGNIPLPMYLSANQAIQSAADEINSVLGMRYIVPIEIASGTQYETSRLLLKRANAHLASGRIIMAADAGGSDNNVHRYGQFLISTANKIIDALSTGATDLIGAPKIEGLDEGTHRGILHNLDTESRVEAFYDQNMIPGDGVVRGYVW